MEKKNLDPTTFVITGPPSSGKSTVTKLIREFALENNIKFSSQKFSTPIAIGIEKLGYKLISENDANYYIKNNEKISQRSLMQDYGNKLRQEYGADALAKLLITKDVEDQMKTGIYVFEGCRNIHEFEFIKSKCTQLYINVQLIGINATLENCYKRANSNKPATFDDFKKQYDLEMKSDAKDNDIQVQKLLEISKNNGIYLENNSDLVSLKETIFSKLNNLN